MAAAIPMHLSAATRSAIPPPELVDAVLLTTTAAVAPLTKFAAMGNMGQVVVRLAATVVWGMQPNGVAHSINNVENLILPHVSDDWPHYFPPAQASTPGDQTGEL
eukprot:TRINITY_DN54408_c0_g1_i1.p3 TRINITY_DN54408_c0_g1~~TRINITY_DN54408_c0_g1_i1.p3  ORF type:complete len:105 (-),score=14.63 TRINITY_DN54408_c0_g1_i1:158-472(-)